jgi:hypothetical protein
MGDLFEIFGDLIAEVILAAAGEIVSNCNYPPANYLSLGPEFHRIVPSASDISHSGGESR